MLTTPGLDAQTPVGENTYELISSGDRVIPLTSPKHMLIHSRQEAGGSYTFILSSGRIRGFGSDHAVHAEGPENTEVW